MPADDTERFSDGGDDDGALGSLSCSVGLLNASASITSVGSPGGGIDTCVSAGADGWSGGTPMPPTYHIFARIGSCSVSFALEDDRRRTGVGSPASQYVVGVRPCLVRTLDADAEQESERRIPRIFLNDLENALVEILNGTNVGYRQL